MTYSPSLVLHICGGIIGVVSGMTALLAGKGSRLHRMAGKVFVISMLFMAGSGALLALLKLQRVNVLAGVLTMYLVATAWLAVKRKPGETGRMEIVLLAVALAEGATALFFYAQRGFGAYLVFASIALLFAGSDVRMLIRGGVAGAQRLARHLWRMGLALFVAAGSFFLGTADDPVMKVQGLRARLFTKAVRDTHLPQVPVLIIVVLTLYWLWRVRFSRRYRRVEARQPIQGREADLAA